MTNREQELEQLKAYRDVLQGRLQKMEDELARLFRLAPDDKSILNCARQLLEILLKELCKDIGLTCGGMMVGTILSKFREKANKIVPDIIPDDIYRSMDHINGLSPAGAHDTPYDPKQVREILVALERVLHWYVVAYKKWSAPLPDTDMSTLPKAQFAGRVERRDQLPPLWQERKQGDQVLQRIQFIKSNLLDKGGYTIAAKECLSIIEFALRELLLRRFSILDADTQRKIKQEEQKIAKGGRGKSIQDFTMGQLLSIIHASNFINAWSKATNEELSTIRIVNLDELTRLRYSLTHTDAEATEAQARFLFHSLQLIIETFGLASLEEETQSDLDHLPSL